MHLFSLLDNEGRGHASDDDTYLVICALMRYGVAECCHFVSQMQLRVLLCAPGAPKHWSCRTTDEHCTLTGTTAAVLPIVAV